MRRTPQIVLSLLVLLAAACGDTDQGSVPRPSTVTTATSATDQAAPQSTVPETTTLPGSTEEENAPTSTEPATTTTLASLDDLALEAVEVANGFDQPILLLAAPGDSRSYVADQPGMVWILDEEPTVFLDIRDAVKFRGEQGLLGLAFHPEYVDNGRFYVHYSAGDGDTVIEEFTARDGAVDMESRVEVYRTDQPAGNHNGGMITFGPDGNLWIGLGDGGGSNDQFGHGQRSDTPLGTMLRIAPDRGSYSVPDGNIDGEVWAFGLRNPWRWAFDGDDLWIADVGQSRIEEISVVDWRDGNPNFGWSILEGSECFRGSGCNTEGLTPPVYEYTHNEGCSITGGFVYRGEVIPELRGQFLFGDYCSGWVRSVDGAGSVREWLAPGTVSELTSFGVDAAGEVYALSGNGTVYALRRAAGE